MEGMSRTPPALGGEERVGIHCTEGLVWRELKLNRNYFCCLFLIAEKVGHNLSALDSLTGARQLIVRVLSLCNLEE